MSTINTHFTFNYSQPEDYRFSHDSVFLARQSFELLEGKSLRECRALDIGAGSGIVGLDFLHHRFANGQNLPKIFDFLEIQEVYAEHFAVNRKASGLAGCELNFMQANYSQLLLPEFADTYDLVVANPPYFLTEHGLLSPCEFKNRCRFFIDSDFATLLKGISNCLKPSGHAYVLLKDLPQHGWHVVEEAKKYCDVEVLGDIRGTLFSRLKRIS